MRMASKVAGFMTFALGIAFVTNASAKIKTVSANLLPNPSFEEREGDGVRDWKPRAWSGEKEGRWIVASREKKGRLCVSIRSEKGADAAWTTLATVEPNALYRLSGWIKTKNVRGATGALLNIQNMQPIRTRAIRGTTGWTRVETLFKTGKVTALEINCLFGGWGSSTGQAWYDDLALERVVTMAGPLQGSVTIDPSRPAKPYSRMIFGGFLEHFDGQVYGGVFDPGSPLSDESGFRKDVIAAMKELKLSVVRWPGGCFASGYHWRDGVGQNRKTVRDPVWGVDDTNAFGTDEFVEWCRRVGCEPYICTNAGNGTPEEMRDWVEYCNPSEGGKRNARRVKYWSIGNENWGGHEIGARTPEEWGPLVARSADLMREADPGIDLVAAATTGADWTLPLLKTAGDRLKYVAIHNYYLPLWGENLTPDYMTCILKSELPEADLSRVIDLLDEARRRGKIKIAFDEWNLRSWHHPGFPRKAPVDPNDSEAKALIQAREKNAIASQYTMADALFSASFLNACLRHSDDVGMANIAPIVNTRGPLYVYPGGIVKRTTFHVLAMYARLLSDRVSETSVESDPLIGEGGVVSALDALATCDASGGKRRIAFANRHPTETLTCSVKIGDKPLEGRHRATILEGDSTDAFNDETHPDRVKPREIELEFKDGKVSLPPHSLTILEAD